jgi:hypothetical protein
VLGFTPTLGQVRVATFVDIEELVGAAIEVERVLGELGETPLESLKEEKE